MKEKLIKTLNIFMKIGLILTIIGMIFFPMVMAAITKTLYNSGYINEPQNFRNIGLVLFYLLAIPYTWMVLNLYKITTILKDENIYSRSIVSNFRKSGYLTIILAIILFIVTLVFTLLTDVYLYALTIALATVMPFILITIGLIFLVVSYVYDEIIRIKEENDLTI